MRTPIFQLGVKWSQVQILSARLLSARLSASVPLVIGRLVDAGVDLGVADGAEAHTPLVEDLGVTAGCDQPF